MKINFTKMHGLGNDFIVIDACQQSIPLTTRLIQQWSNRHRGIGFDQLLLIQPSKQSDCELFYRIFNADGQEVEQCGNGARCFAHYVYDHGLVKDKTFKVETVKGKLELTIDDDGLVTVDMGQPEFSPASIPFKVAEQMTTYNLPLNNTDVDVSVLSMGNPHCVLIVDDIDHAPVPTIGQEIAQSSFFPAGVNVGFMQIVTPSQIKLRVLERGAGETQACGSGACAAVVAGRMQNLLTESVNVELLGGQLSITWQGMNHSVFMTGPATYVFNGEIER